MHLFRIEGVNLAHSIEDTEDLSTRRGGSLMLLEVINEIEKKNISTLKRISTGASAGLFKVTGDAAAAIDSIKELLQKEPYRYGTFVLDTVQGEEAEFPSLERSAVAANRWRQMQRLSFSPMGLDAGSLGICAVDEVRPAQRTMSVKGKNQQVSTSVQARRKHGVRSKRDFYNRTLESRYSRFKFAKDFEKITDGKGLDLQPRTLNGKLAVFYADGNNFGAIARGCNKAELEKWDGYIKGQRNALLSALLDHAATQKHWLAGSRLRLETLLWGGDELMFAVPGWCGMELARLFIEQTQGMKYKLEGKDKSLTHACGLVFCHHQAPISRISHLAKALAEKGKEANREANSLNWLVLESFDHTGSGLDDYLERRFGETLKWPDLALDSHALDTLAQDFPSLRNELPRSAIVHITRALAEHGAFDAEGKEMPLIRRARQQVEEAGGEKFKTLWSKLHPKKTAWDIAVANCDDLGAWLKLAELWDYCPDWNNSDQQGAQS
ncbi:MAG: hypothetical protein KJ558_04540 [Gammaproteobacteria bacterium]|nr:hypothetical protein [Gammaproteobacteria bacterium]MBU1654089.1 hypothetical protein [Gammaproteobacteria bacterium]MBU1961370.1 hypothetical protein [Gammaproteobacteria bacterium]